MLRGLLISFAMLALVSAADAGTCSTGEYKSCVRCCNTNPNIKNSPAQCAAQCRDYLKRR
jgi:hypothetical protein